MWRTTFFRHPPEIPPSPESLRRNPPRTFTGSLLRRETHLCGMCHAELEPGEFADGCCQDKAACCGRVFSQRCW